jgi:hypothetical protein
MDVPEIKQAVAEEVVLRRELTSIYVPDFLEEERQLREEWEKAYPELVELARSKFEEHCPLFNDSPSSESRMELLILSVRKLHAHLSQGETFESSNQLGGDPYLIMAIDGLEEALRLGKCSDCRYSGDLEILNRVKAEINGGGVLRGIQRNIVPSVSPDGLDKPAIWEESMSRREVILYFKEFEAEHAMPGHLTSSFQSTLEVPPKGCRVRAATVVLQEAKLPERILHLFDLSLFETNAMVRFFHENADQIQSVVQEDPALMEYIETTQFWTTKQSSPGQAQSEGNSSKS